MLIQTIPESRAVEAALVSSLIEEFLANGGTITELPPPSPPAKIPKLEYFPPIKVEKPTPEPAKQNRFKKCVPAMIEEFDAGHTLSDIAKRYKQSREVVTRFIELHGRDTMANRYNHLKEDESLIAAIRQFAADRFSQEHAAAQLGISRAKVARIAKSRSIAFSAPRGKR